MRRGAGAAAVLWLLACATPEIGRKPARDSSRDSLPATGQAPARRTVPEAVPVLPPATDSTVAWDQLVRIIRATPDSLLAVRQTHARRVTAVMRDGTRFHSTEPRIDEIIALVRQVDPSGRILVATE